MKDTTRIAFTTLIIFGAGLGIGIWTQRIQPVPPPPMPPLGEMRKFGGPPDDKRGGRFGPTKTKDMEAAMEKLRPQMQAFEDKLQQLDADFRQKFEATLTPEQKKILAEKGPPATSTPPNPGQTPDRMMRPMGGMAFFTIITPAATHFSKELQLTPEQEANLLALLKERRQQFLDYVDANPPPSLELGRMAPRD